MPVIVLLPLVPAMATPGCPPFTSSASNAGRLMRHRPSATAARISGVDASTAVEWTKRSMAGVTALPSCGRSSTPSARSEAAISAFLP